MSEAVSASQGAEFDGAVRVAEAGLRGMITLRGDFGSVAFKNAATGVAGVDFPGVREVKVTGDRGLAWMSPDELLVMVPYGEAEAAVATMSETLAGSHFLAVNVSDARAVFRIEGPGAREVLAKGAPVDLSPAAFGPGEIRRTRLGQVAAAFWMTGEDAFELVCFRSVAGYMFDWLSVAAAEGSLPDYF